MKKGRTISRDAAEGVADAFALGRALFKRNLRTRPTRDLAKNSKRLLREHFRGKSRPA